LERYDAGIKEQNRILVVNGVDDARHVIVRDPFNGIQYKMDVDTFNKVWGGCSVCKQWS
jgi:hypothetical protein